MQWLEDISTNPKQNILKPYLGKFIRVYVDYFCMYGGKDDHSAELKATFIRLQEFKGSLLLDKCSFAFMKLSFVGHVI